MANHNHEDLINSFQSFSKDEELLSKVIEFFPYPIQIYSPDGTSAMVNKAMLNEYHTQDANLVVGKYNIFTDPSIIKMGQLSKVKKAFKGETVFFKNIKVPLDYIKLRYGIVDMDLEAVFQDITLFPIFDNKRNVVYVAAFLMNREVYKSRDKIEKARMYIEKNWNEKFNLEEIASFVGLSRAHFAKLFKNHTGITPFEHYNNYRISKVKEKLIDTNLSIFQAFNECGMEYNGHYAKVFKDLTGYSPSEYRKKME